MSHVVTSPPTNRTPTTRTRVVGRWMVSFVGFPLGGFAALVLTAPVDSVGHAVLGGLITGGVLGAVQAWALRLDRGRLAAWTLATALGLAAGLTLGASLVDFGTGLGDLAVQGAMTGALVGVAQAVVLRPRTGPLALAWPVYLAGAYALGWVITTVGGIAVEEQFTTFGSFGALTVALVTSVLPVYLATHPTHREEQLMTRHVVFGTGQVGHPLVEQLVAQGHDVVAVNRDGRGHFPSAQIVGGDATDPAFTTAVCQGADVVYFCLNATKYERWTEEFPPLQRGVLAGAASARARLVVLDNLYAYGPPNGQRLVETMAANPTSAKSATRAAMTEDLLATHATGQVEVVIGRASDYFGPGATRSALGETVFGTALAGKAAQVMGDPDQPHSHSYTPDVARGLITLGSAPEASGQVWHLPVAETRTIRQVVEAVYGLAGHDPWVVDDSKFRAAFGDLTTPFDDALFTTLAWYAHRAAVPAH